MLAKFNFSRHFVTSIVTKQRNEAATQHEIELMNKPQNKIVECTKINKRFMEHDFFNLTQSV